MVSEPEPSKEPKKPAPFKGYLKYSSLAMQLVLVIGAMGWLGYQLDRLLHIRFPVFMVLFVFLAFAGVVYRTYRSINDD